MRYSQTIGILAAIALIAVCFFPWISVPSVHLVLSGTNGTVNNELDFGRQLIPHGFLSLLTIIFFMVPAVWAKRTNIFIAFINLSWAIKNYILFSMCRTGECPQVHPALYLLVVFAVIMQLMSFLPKMKLS